METTNRRKNPSRKECEDIIRRILMTEVLEKGTNEHFKNATDFLGYFQSLYPAGDALTKQVQRAVKALNMPKDAKGYYIINKTEEQLGQDQELSYILKKAAATPVSLEDCETLFLQVSSDCKDYLLQLLEKSATFQDKYVTIQNTSKGLLFYTKNKQQLLVLLDSLVKK